MLRYIHDRITVHPDLCGGRPTIRGHRLTVQQVLESLTAGDTPAEILEDFDFLEPEDITACQQFALKIALEALRQRTYLPAAA
ncbi:DUF433 domain-containing protein [Hymenobacter siberiensis]|jgi:uncharacterized protein (DUF433 family)|uniref:DUF433 domain-containing protein n=1 Tax=Hymenobacter siberiensis TaxID=2848396 RepID=UPI001C1DD75F|nr:DUF433 domain-containing protein [Hymenobacter siberiensis]